MKNILIFVLIPATIFLIGCDTNLKPARGIENEIIVFADSVEFEELRVSLEQVFEKEIETPQPEKIFELKRVNYSDFQKYRTIKNIIFLAPFSSNHEVAKFIKNSLDSTATVQIKNKKVSYILKKNLWAKGQLVLLLTSPTLAELEFELVKNSNKLSYAFQKASDARLLTTIYNARYEQKNIEAKLLKDYGWMIYVQADFTLAVNRPDEKFIWLRRSPNSDMERWIFIHWIDDASGAMLNRDSIITLRNKLTEKFYRTSDDKYFVTIADSVINTTEINFNNRYALYSQGLWRTTDKFMGGPFVSYTFYDEQTKRIYMVDGSIYAPKYYKRNLIQQVDVILQSFLTESEISVERKESLFKELDD
jgi:hypothetical protein